ncbi:apical endosomal glycoprotein [Varanus komodoensis]|uniref:apical endosomal glycoprotein n=1 Tax=Varanus komodoensis TaxID=61221 RepID=UPI001CF7C829|nr:apical endosomal glycoprotein [Varanus komodoensis]
MVGAPGLLCLLLLENLAAVRRRGLLCLPAAPALAQAALVNRCRGPSASLCDFVCDCWDCSDENQCGYQKESVALGTAFACDFEGSACGWEDVSTSGYQWAPAQSSIARWGSEPPFDHTTGTDLGWYMSTSRQRVKPSATAQLRSPLLREAAATCEIRAWYHLSDPGLNESSQPALTLELRHGSDIVTLWRNPPGSASPWRELVAYTGRVHGAFQVTFAAAQAASGAVQLALDDVEFRNCGPPRPQACAPDEHRCGGGGCVAPDRQCDGTEDCRDGGDEAECSSSSKCDFEAGWCGWAAEPGRPLLWLRNSSTHLGPSPAQPTRDHSTNGRAGYFVYLGHVPPSDPQPGGAWLVSPVLTANLSCQLVLYVHLRASAYQCLNVYYRTEQAMVRVRTRCGDLGDCWVRETVEFRVAEKFQIIIEGLLGTGPQGSLALDDLILSPGCSSQAGALLVGREPSPPSPCTRGQFACSDGKQCLGAELVCNFEADCADGSDEQQCGSTAFTNGTGGWVDVSVGRLQWALQKSTGQSDPAGDHFSLQEGTGQMLGLARAATPALGPSGLACALEMTFRTGPRGLLALAVADESLGTSRWLWHRRGNGSVAWAQAHVPLGARARPFQLELLAMTDLRGSGAAAPPAVSSVSLVDCDPAAPAARASGLSCNFERGWCGWFLEQNDGFAWEWRAGGGWAPDHTTGTGAFLSADPSAAGAHGLRARLVSAPQVADGNASCLVFWYRMDGPQIGTLALLVKQAGKAEQVLWTRTGSQGAVWHRGLATISLPPGQSYQVVFEALRDGFLGAMGLDDLSVRPRACGAQKHCSFEADDCGLVASRPQTWARQDGAGGRGPPTDHTRGTPAGHYMLVNTSAAALPSGQAALLRSQAFLPLPRPQCLSFWYHPSGSSPGSLQVSVEEGSLRREMLRVSSLPAEGWRYGSFTVRVQGEWQVAFSVEGAGGGPSSFFALDDLRVAEGACLGTGSCDFESGTCGWSKPHGDWYSWDWKQGATPAQSPSPEEDHTFGTTAGHYAYVDTAALGPGRNAPARLASEPLPPTSGSCLQFYHRMDSLGQSSSATLRVKLQSLQGERTVWSATGTQSRAWLNQTLVVSSLTEFQVVLEATGGAWPRAETIAVDDISYKPGPRCDTDPPRSQEEGSGSSGGSAAGLVAGLVCAVLLALAAVATAFCCWTKLRRAGGVEPGESSAARGFNNITYRDDIVILPRMSTGGETE